MQDVNVKTDLNDFLILCIRCCLQRQFQLRFHHLRGPAGLAIVAAPRVPSAASSGPRTQLRAPGRRASSRIDLEIRQQPRGECGMERHSWWRIEELPHLSQPLSRALCGVFCSILLHNFRFMSHSPDSQDQEIMYRGWICKAIRLLIGSCGHVNHFYPMKIFLGQK